MSFDLRAYLAKLNAKLDKVAIIKQSSSNRLSLRATLPAKPTDPTDKPKQRTLATGKRANKAGADGAMAMAKRLDSEIYSDTFDWLEWDPKLKERARPKTIGELTEQLLEIKRPQVQRLGLKQRYKIPLSKLPQDAIPTEELLKQILIAECSGYPAKWAGYKIAYGMLLDLAGIEHSLQKLGPKNANKIKTVTPEDLPSDELILNTWGELQNPLYKILFARMACYGLRPHESWKCTVSSDPAEPWCEIPEDTKTGQRLVLPLPKSWYELMQPWQGIEEITKVDWKARENTYLGRLISQHFSRRGVPFSPYMLRHAWAVRSATAGVGIVIASKMMGHSEAVHQRTYQQALGRDGLMMAWERINSGT